MNSDPYNAEVRRLFATTAHAGELADGVAASAQTDTVRIRLSATVVDERLLKLRFLAWGCPHVIAACEAFCECYEGSALTDMEAFEVNEIMQTLAVPVEKTGRILVLEDAARALATATRKGA